MIYHLIRIGSLLVYLSYGATMVLIYEQWDQVSHFASVARIIMWQIVLLDTYFRTVSLERDNRDKLL